MSIIIGLREKEHIRENIGDLGLFTLIRKGIMHYENEFEFETGTLSKLENEFKKYIRSNAVIRKPRMIDRSRSVYSDFFKQLCTAISSCNSTNSEDSNPNKYTVGKWTFFTTNYDNIVEDFWEHYNL